jgi:hypothetical protein
MHMLAAAASKTCHCCLCLTSCTPPWLPCHPQDLQLSALICWLPLLLPPLQSVLDELDVPPSLPPSSKCSASLCSQLLAAAAAAAAPRLQSVLDELDVPHRWPAGSPERGVYCSRTLNLRSIKAIGYDMDYTLIHYDVNAWEVRGGGVCSPNGRCCTDVQMLYRCFPHATSYSFS